MDWKREAIGKLRDYEPRKQAIRNVKAELAVLEDDLVNLPGVATDGIRITGSSGDRESSRLYNIARRVELERVLKQTRAQLDIVRRALMMLTADERRVLDRFFMRPIPSHVGKLCGELNIERSGVYRLKDRALHRFTIALYGATES